MATADIGCYMIGEEIHAGRQWVDTDLSHGFLVELDAYPNDEYCFEQDISTEDSGIRQPV